MDKIEQPRRPAIFVNNTEVYSNCISIVVGVHIVFIDKESIPELQRSLNKYINLPKF